MRAAARRRRAATRWGSPRELARAWGSRRPTTTRLGVPPARRAWGSACQGPRRRDDPNDRS
ncbi:hypothetical protein EAO75_19850 [Streptomyces sp. uw30]|nr:hypothetical protein EAO75_19850 [Streptomyces sp. uw30]